MYSNILQNYSVPFAKKFNNTGQDIVPNVNNVWKDMIIIVFGLETVLVNIIIKVSISF